jgi:outer membrane murein-binding lipoprotein Lpp
MENEMELNNRIKHCQTKYNISFIILVSVIVFVSLTHAIFFVYVVIYLKDNANTLLAGVMSEVENKINILSNDISKRLQDEISRQLITLNNQIATLTSQLMTQQSRQQLFLLKMNELMQCTCNITQ